MRSASRAITSAARGSPSLESSAWTRSAAVVQAVERRASLKRWLGHPLFITAGLTTWIRGYDRREPHFALTSPDHGSIPDGFFTIVLNTSPYTYLGNRPLDLSPAATLDRGLVAITFRTLRVGPILRGLGGALRGGGVVTSEQLVEWDDVARLTVEGTAPFPYQVDGDYLGAVERLSFDHVPDAVPMVFPVVDSA